MKLIKRTLNILMQLKFFFRHKVLCKRYNIQKKATFLKDTPIVEIF
jgi:hypothetical protein